MSTRIVFVHLPGADTAVPAGRLRLSSDRQSGEIIAADFQYGARYVERGNAVAIDPVSLPLPPRGTAASLQRPINGLPMFGAIRDSAPDLWGRRVIENRLNRPGPLPELDYLDQAGSDRAGALDVRVSVDSPPSPSTLPTPLALTYLLEAVQRIESGEPVPTTLMHYFEGGPSLGGMRPKAVIQADGVPYLAKFPSARDRFNVPAVEFATLALAREAGLNVPQTQLLNLDERRQVLLIRRFDRPPVDQGGPRLGMVSALTMLGIGEMDSPNMGYADIADAISRHAPAQRIQRDREELYGRMVFNILVSNSDDHLRNHAFLFDSQAVRPGWGLSPLYDVVPTPSASHERSLHLAVGDMGRAARLDNALTQAGQFGLGQRQAALIIDRIHGITRQWRQTFEASGVSRNDCDVIASAFLHAQKHLGLAAVSALLDH